MIKKNYTMACVSSKKRDSWLIIYMLIEDSLIKNAMEGLWNNISVHILDLLIN